MKIPEFVEIGVSTTTFPPTAFFKERCLGGAIEPVLACAWKVVLAVVALKPWVWVGRDSLEVVPVGTFFVVFLSLFMLVWFYFKRISKRAHKLIKVILRSEVLAFVINWTRASDQKTNLI